MAAPVYQPTYIIDQDPMRFGGRQNDYLTRSNSAIKETAEKITAAKREGHSLIQLFFSIIAELSSVGCVEKFL